MHLVRHVANPVGELLLVHDKLLGDIVPPQLEVAPAVVNVDVLVPEVLEAEIHDKLGGLEEDSLVYVAAVLVPRAPPEGGDPADVVGARELSGGQGGEREPRGEEVVDYTHLGIALAQEKRTGGWTCSKGRGPYI